MVCLKETTGRPLCLFQATSLVTKTMLVLEGCLLATAMLGLDELENAPSNGYKWPSAGAL